MLVILDDIWLSEQEKAMNPLDPNDSHSRLLVSTRIRRLLSGSSAGKRGTVVEVDVGLLTMKEAVKLLLETAKMLEDGALDEALEPPKEAVEIAELCGLLPLTVAIAGGVVMNHGGLDDDLVAIIRIPSFMVLLVLSPPGQVVLKLFLWGLRRFQKLSPEVGCGHKDRGEGCGKIRPRPLPPSVSPSPSPHSVEAAQP